MLLQYISTEEQDVDILTKASSKCKFEFHRDRIRVADKLDLILQLVLMMNHTGWFETRRKMKYHVIYAEKSLVNLIWITEALIQQSLSC